MKDFLGNEMPISAPPKFEFNKNEITLTNIEREALLRGMSRALDFMLQDLRLIKNPRKELVASIAKIETQLKEIENEYGKFKPE
jgi:hypothetical protein